MGGFFFSYKLKAVNLRSVCLAQPTKAQASGKGYTVALNSVCIEATHKGSRSVSCCKIRWLGAAPENSCAQTGSFLAMVNRFCILCIFIIPT